MPSLEERVAYLEGKTEEHSGVVTDLRHSIRDLRDEVIRGFEQVDRRFEAMDRRFEAIDGRFNIINAKIDRQLVWVLGMMVTGFVTVIGALVGIVYR